MSKIKTFFLVAYIGTAGYTLLGSATSSIGRNLELCENRLVKPLVHWSSGCQFRAYFSLDPVPQKTLEYEQSLLEKFSLRNGLAADVLWYRSVFHQKFQHRLKTSFEEIHQMHLRYTQAQHRRVDLQLDYIRFLEYSDLLPLAQSALDDYCRNYVNKARGTISKQLKLMSTELQLVSSNDRCNSLR